MIKVLRNILIAAAVLIPVAACNDADVASQNISKAADNFEIMRRVVLYNGITNEYIQSVEELCSLGNNDSQGEVSVTCKSPHGFVKHIWKLGDNVTVFAQQLDDVDVSVNHYRVTFKPQTILPDIDFRGDASDLTRNRN